MTDESATQEPVLFLSPDGTIHPRPLDPTMLPIIEIAVSRMAIDGKLGWSGDPRRQCLAMIDTGAEWNYIDSELANNLSLAPARTIQVKSATGSIMSRLYDCDIFMINSRTLVRNQFVAAPLAAQMRPYCAIIGRVILNQCRLLWNVEPGTFELRFPAARA